MPPAYDEIKLDERGARRWPRSGPAPICRVPGRCPNVPSGHFGNPGAPLGEIVYNLIEKRR